jgi:hypothetical protein
MASTALARAFPRPGDIPERWRYTPSDVGLRLITGGGLKLWQGASQQIRSAVCVRDDADGLSAARARSPRRRRTPRKASRRSSGGRGLAGRTRASGRARRSRRASRRSRPFTAKAQPLREQVAEGADVGGRQAVRRLPWSEFDRTLEYIDATDHDAAPAGARQRAAREGLRLRRARAAARRSAWRCAWARTTTRSTRCSRP